MHKIAALAAILVSIHTVNAQRAPVKKALRILTSEEADPSRLLPPPSEDGSPAQKLEMTDLKRLLAARTAERFAQAQWDNSHEDATIFGSVLGPAYDLSRLPATAKLLAVVLNDQAVVASAAKDYFHRKFPSVVDPGLVDLNCEPDLTRTHNAAPAGRAKRSYPSGHGTLGYSVGTVLAVLIPEKSQAILARAADYAYSRLVCAEHYHSDIEASQSLGTALGVMLLHHSELGTQIDAAKAELRQAGLTR